MASSWVPARLLLLLSGVSGLSRFVPMVRVGDGATVVRLPAGSCGAVAAAAEAAAGAVVEVIGAVEAEAPVGSLKESGSGAAQMANGK